MQTLRIVRELSFEEILVTNDGAVTIKADTKEILNDFSFYMEDLSQVIHDLRKKNIHFSVCTAFDYYVEYIDNYQKEQCEKYETEYKIVDDVLLLKEKIMKFTISDNHFVGGWQDVQYPDHLRKRADAEYFKEIVNCKTYKTNAIINVLQKLKICPKNRI